MVEDMVSASGNWDWTRISPLLPLEVQDHIAVVQPPQCNLASTSGSIYGVRWASRFAIYYWLLWKDRCSVVLDSDNVPRDDILARGNRLVTECVNVLNSRLRNPTSDSLQAPQWSRPAQGWILQQTSHSLSENRLVASIRYWTDHNWKLVILHISRTCNMLADKLSAWGSLNSQQVETFSCPPLPLVAAVDTDKSS
ncbi:hypothetical protein V6N11_082926 [Hibiscus sabdariffa]|uniref:RNase H type-1 domain-containing protein n=1 Tax=Hibiscus sabdariffa TaxID=183260 RepID=A0ABR2QKA7_9ROSI